MTSRSSLILAHVRRLQPRGDVPVDVAHVVVVLVFAQVGEIEAEAAEQRAVVAVQQAVETADHRPLEPPQDAPQDLRGRRLGHGVSSGFSGAGTCCMHALDRARRRVMPVGERLVGQHEAVAQHVGREVGDVLGQHVVAAAQERERPRALDQVDRRARARAEREVAREVLDAVALRDRASPRRAAPRTGSATGRRSRLRHSRCSAASCVGGRDRRDVAAARR